MMQTSRQGIFAAGDIATFPGKLKLIATGFAEGCTAVNFAKHYLGNRHVDKNFEVTDAVMQDFRKFLDSQNIPYTEADLNEGSDYIKSNIKTELFISEFGQEEGLRVRAENDPQVVAALNQLPKAKELAENARKIVAQRAAAQATR